MILSLKFTTGYRRASETLPIVALSTVIWLWPLGVTIWGEGVQPKEIASRGVELQRKVKAFTFVVGKQDPTDRYLISFCL
jgi:hypothetical protein